MHDRTPYIIFDNCVLSNFSTADSLDIVKKFYAGSAHVTSFVVAENIKGILKGHDGLLKVRDAIKAGWIKEIPLDTTEEKTLFETLSISLGFGEASSIAIAKTRGFVFACDDKIARKEAAFLGVKLTGTVGILIKAIKKEIIDSKEADSILNRMIANGFYSPVNSLSQFLSPR
ncbi:MAG: hypothetical protein COW32_08535 [Candidatus Aquicultor secundus]|uniref:DUF3368 domain-containing protein n=1 Tax=Candidatus Aquicultor secundus TaxID=1973895 RepID=A0A2M7T528_9ACTN|nr:DUF3368 domain-containing protein [Candidatus Aquicultor secundus]NCO65490.1 DUF3368 domain-containing protein [Solirubrobacter sp.]OIO88677.1 MAG: hypothetical protein AUK32_00800 [Candidatus Aquicultor secundus]PIU26883.1 MAG: hypothetical protein COT10_06380 [Candidatus Aquicultor secundus]PIW21708.1 MAG: hypothetical protein COW32_08535 [Candidatus Aquicultor secundus]PIX51723.1 MAG: hypothetical protein COZ51_08100 [Candidatus Aquicultor secundus]